MEISGHTAIVTGGASGLGAATARMLASKGVKITIFDLNENLGVQVAEEIGGEFVSCDVSDEGNVINSFDQVRKKQGPARLLVNCAGIGNASRVVGRNGAHKLELFKQIIDVNLVGTFNIIRVFALEISDLVRLRDDERGAVIMTSSVAAFDGQIGQAAYSASKGGIHSMTLPIAREFADVGIRICTIAPGVLKTPLMDILPENVQKSLGESIPFPRRLGHADEYAALALHIFENSYLNGETIRLDGAIRMTAR